MWALTWSTAGFTAISIQLEGSDDNVTFTAFTGASVVIAGSNPSTDLSGTIKVSATSHNAYLRVTLNSVTGTGTVSFQLRGSSGILSTASVGGGGSATPTGPAGGDLCGTYPDPSVCKVNGAAVPANLAVVATNSSSQLVNGVPVPTAALSRHGTGTEAQTYDGLPSTPGNCASYDLNGTLTDSGSDCTFANVVIKNGANTVSAPFTLDMSAASGSNAVKLPVKAGATATSNGAVVYDSTNNNLHAAQSSADAIVALTKITPTNGNCVQWLNSGGTLNLGDAGFVCGSGSGGGGVIAYSSSADVLLGTQFLPPGGGAPASSTESDVQVASPAAATVSNLHVQLSSPLGAGITAVFTWRDAGSSTSVTCTISGAVAKSCSDTTHSFNAAAGDLLDIQVVTTGTPAALNVLFTSAFGTSNVGVTSVFGNSGPTVGATGDIGATGTVVAVNGGAVPASATVVATNSSNQLIAATYQGNGAKVQLSTGTTTTGNCVKFDANGNTVDAGAACGTGSGGDLTLISSQTLGSPAASITFSSIPGTYSSLIVKFIGRSSASAQAENLSLTINADSGSNYNNEQMAAAGTTVSAGTNSSVGPSTAFVAAIPGASAASGSAAAVDISIPWYAQTTFWKPCTSTFGWNDGSNNHMQNVFYLWKNTAAITSLTLTEGSGANLVTGTSAALYGFK